MKKIIVFTVLFLLPLILIADTYNVMGVYVQELSQKKIDVLGLDNNYGVQIDAIVKDGPADMAGLKKDDIILKIDSAKVRTTGQLGKMLQLYKAGTKVKVEYLREGVNKSAQVVLMEKIKKVKPFMGVILNELSKKEFLAADMKDMYGIEIKKVVPDTAAEKAELQRGDILMQINGEKVFTQSQLDEILRDFAPGDKLKLQIFRDGKKHNINLTLGQRHKEDKM